MFEVLSEYLVVAGRIEAGFAVSLVLASLETPRLTIMNGEYCCDGAHDVKCWNRVDVSKYGTG